MKLSFKERVGTRIGGPIVTSGPKPVYSLRNVYSRVLA